MEKIPENKPELAERWKIGARYAMDNGMVGNVSVISVERDEAASEDQILIGLHDGDLEAIQGNDLEQWLNDRPSLDTPVIYKPADTE